jgi:hypothetical protein
VATTTDATSTGTTAATTTTVAPADITAGESFSAGVLATLSTIEAEGFVRQPQAFTTPTRVGMRYDEAGGGGLLAEVTVGPCAPEFCWDLQGQADVKAAQWKESLPERHRDDPDLALEHGLIGIAPGYEAFFLYTRSFTSSGASVGTVNGYSVQYHDGVNWISILVTPDNASLPDDAAELEAQMDQAKGEQAARTIFAAFESSFLAQ